MGRWPSIDARARSLLAGAVLFAWLGHAADVRAEEAPQETAQEATEPTLEAAVEAAAPRRLPRAAIVVVGDPNPDAVELAQRAQALLEGVVQFPSDPAIVSSLLGIAGEDAIPAIARSRRTLGASEPDDVPTLAALGDHADVAILILLRARAGEREAVVFDVRHRGFFEGTLPAAELDARLARFTRARARAALADPEPDAAVPEAAAPEAAAAALSDRAVEAPGANLDAAGQPHDEPDWFEQNWPYLVAGGLLAGAAVFVIVTMADDQDPVPMLRFRPGGGS